MKRAKYFLILTLMTFSLTSLCANLESVKSSKTEDMTVNFIHDSQDHIHGRLIHADEANFLFHNEDESTFEVIARSDVQYLETNLSIDLMSYLKQDAPKDFCDMIELNDGTRLDVLVLDIGMDEIQYFVGNSMKREVVQANSVYMVHLDGDTVSIPFPAQQAQLLLP